MYKKKWEEQLWEIWLHDPMKEMPFNEFLEKQRMNLERYKSKEQHDSDAKRAEKELESMFGKVVKLEDG